MSRMAYGGDRARRDGRGCGSAEWRPSRPGGRWPHRSERQATELRRRRTTTARPQRPVAISVKVAGSGTVVGGPI